jgi:hypothetical protein
METLALIFISFFEHYNIMKYLKRNRKTSRIFLMKMPEFSLIFAQQLNSYNERRIIANKLPRAT